MIVVGAHPSLRRHLQFYTVATPCREDMFRRQHQKCPSGRKPCPDPFPPSPQEEIQSSSKGLREVEMPRLQPCRQEEAGNSKRSERRNSLYKNPLMPCKRFTDYKPSKPSRPSCRSAFDLPKQRLSPYLLR